MDETTLEKPKAIEDRPASRDPAAGSLYRELWPTFASWARHTFSLPSVISGLRSLLWVAPLSVIIWIYADRQLTPPPQPVSIALGVSSSDPTRIVRLIEPPDGKVHADLDGPNALLQSVVKQVESGTPALIDIPESSLQTPGNHRLDSSLLNDLPLFSQNSITVDHISPPELLVNVDVLESVTVEVQPGPDGKNFTSPPVFEPRKVTVRAPESIIKSGLVVYANLDEVKEQLTPGPHDISGIPLALSTGDTADVTITPAAVSAHVEIKKSDVTATLDSIPIWAIYPPGLDDRYKAVYDPTISHPIVTGPEDQIRALQSHTFQPMPKATFEVDAADTSTDVGHEARLSYELAPGVHISPDFAQKTITYRLVERKSD